MKTKKFETFKIADKSLGNILGGAMPTSSMSTTSQCKIKCPDGSILSSPSFGYNCTTNGTPSGTIQYQYRDRVSGNIFTLTVSCDDTPVQV